MEEGIESHGATRMGGCVGCGVELRQGNLWALFGLGSGGFQLWRERGFSGWGSSIELLCRLPWGIPIGEL